MCQFFLSQFLSSCMSNKNILPTGYRKNLSAQNKLRTHLIPKLFIVGAAVTAVINAFVLPWSWRDCLATRLSSWFTEKDRLHIERKQSHFYFLIYWVVFFFFFFKELWCYAEVVRMKGACCVDNKDLSFESQQWSTSLSEISVCIQKQDIYRRYLNCTVYVHDVLPPS